MAGVPAGVPLRATQPRPALGISSSSGSRNPYGSELIDNDGANRRQAEYRARLFTLDFQDMFPGMRLKREEWDRLESGLVQAFLAGQADEWQDPHSRDDVPPGPEVR